MRLIFIIFLLTNISYADEKFDEIFEISKFLKKKENFFQLLDESKFEKLDQDRDFIQVHKNFFLKRKKIFFINEKNIEYKFVKVNPSKYILSNFEIENQNLLHSILENCMTQDGFFLNLMIWKKLIL